MKNATQKQIDFLIKWAHIPPNKARKISTVVASEIIGRIIDRWNRSAPAKPLSAERRAEFERNAKHRTDLQRAREERLRQEARQRADDNRKRRLASLEARNRWKADRLKTEIDLAARVKSKPCNSFCGSLDPIYEDTK